MQENRYEIAPKAHGQFELVGYSPELLKLFSTRRQQIESLVALWEAEGKTLFSQDGRVLKSRLAMYEAAALKSRKRKPTPMQPEQLRRGWKALALIEGFLLPKLPTRKSVEGQSIEPTAIPTLSGAVPLVETVDADVQLAIEHCSEREAVFRRTALERFLFEHRLGQKNFDHLQQDIFRCPELVQIEENRMTTQTAIQLELETIQSMREGKGSAEAMASLPQVEEQISESLTIEQRQAISLVMATPDAVMAWQGSAGVGKTYALSQVRGIAQSQGYEVYGFAPSAEAAHTLGEALQIETSTVAGLLVSAPQDPERSLWIVDEAGLLNMKDAHALLQRAQRENARVLLVGDTKQLSAVEAGNPFKSLQAGGMTLARLDNSLRQKTEELRLAVRLISEGKIARGIDVLEQAGCLQIDANLDNRINQVVSDYLALSPAERTETLLLAGTNQERLSLVESLRQALQAEGSLGEDALTVFSLRRKDLTKVQAQYLVAYEPGDVLTPTQDYKKQGLTKYQHYTVRSVDWEAKQLVVETADGQLLSVDPLQCKRKTVYSAQTLSVAVGDRLRWTKNDRKTKTRNGQQFMVAEVLAGGTVRAVDETGQSQWFPLSGHQHLDYAWVSTTYSSQGKTADRVLALMSEKTTNLESFYVAVSRAKHGLKLYTADKDELLKRSQVSKAKKNASDYIPLFKVGENYAKTSKESKRENGRKSSSAANANGRNIGKRVGDRLARKLASQLSTHADRHQRARPANEFDRTGTSADNGSFESFAEIFDRTHEPLSRAIAEHIEQSELIEGERFFAEAVAAVNHSFEQLERSAKNRNRLAAAVDQFDAAVGGKASTAQFGLAEGKAASAAKEPLDYKALWQYYQQGVKASSRGEMDYRVGRRAVEDGGERRAISLMLVSGSAAVQQIHRSDGKQRAMKYVNYMSRRIFQGQSIERVNKQASTKRQMELEE